jgi:hypothetical protein
MAGYPGRYDFGIFRKNFGGIDQRASLISVPDNAAFDITNFNIIDGGYIERRGGISQIYDFGSPVVYFTKFISNGTDVFFAVTANGKFWSATDLSGPWTERTGSVVWTDFGTTNAIIGASLGSKLVLCNGVDQPLVYVHGSNMQTLKDASLQAVGSTSGTNTKVGAGGAGTVVYGVVGVTPRGETVPFFLTVNNIAQPTYGGGQFLFPSNPGANTAIANLTAANYNSLTWVNNGEFTAFKIYRWTVTLSGGQYYVYANAAQPIATLGAAASSYQDQTSTVPTVTTALGTSTAYNTPADWESSGPPKGMAYVGKNRDERLFAWRGNTIWACGLSECTNWFREDDAFVFTVIGAEDTQIRGIAGLFDYTMIFSRNSCFLYQGASPTTIRLDKVVSMGCLSHNSITYSDVTAWWWSQYGPTSADRILSGADVSMSSSVGDRIQPLIQSITDSARWPFVCGTTDVTNNRVYWGVSKTGSSVNDETIVLQSDVSGFTRYEGFSWVGACSHNNDVYIGSSDGKIYKMNTGDTDNGTPITATYTTGWMDMGSYSMNKRMAWVDVIVDRRPGNYTFSFNYSVDFGQVTGTAQTATQTTTNGQTIETTSSTATEHRFYTDAIGNCFQLVFSTSSSTPLRLVAWRPEIRARGVRQ